MSWFSDSSANVGVDVVFDTSLADQIRSFESKGFVIIRARADDADGQATIKMLEKEVLELLESRKDTLWYRVQRYFSSVRADSLRHCIPLPSSPSVLKVLAGAIQRVRPLLLSGALLTSNSPLVELSSIVSLPGAERQKSHSDTAMTTRGDLIISGFLALTPVTLQNGPTFLFAGTHKKRFHDAHVDNPTGRPGDGPMQYSSDGSLAVFVDAASVSASTTASRVIQQQQQQQQQQKQQQQQQLQQDVEDAEAVATSMSSAPIAATLATGDILLYDTKLFHYGSANTSEAPRALFFFAFQNCTKWGSKEIIDGFTYHIHSSMDNRYHLDSFKL
jgi:hypothetical protein